MDKFKGVNFYDLNNNLKKLNNQTQTLYIILCYFCTNNQYQYLFLHTKVSVFHQYILHRNL